MEEPRRTVLDVVNEKEDGIDERRKITTKIFILKSLLNSYYFIFATEVNKFPSEQEIDLAFWR